MKKINLIAVIIRLIAASVCIIATLGGSLFTNDWYGFITIWMMGAAGTVLIDECIAKSFK